MLQQIQNKNNDNVDVIIDSQGKVLETTTNISEPSKQQTTMHEANNQQHVVHIHPNLFQQPPNLGPLQTSEDITISKIINQINVQTKTHPSGNVMDKGGNIVDLNDIARRFHEKLDMLAKATNGTFINQQYLDKELEKEENARNRNNSDHQSRFQQYYRSFW